MLVHQWHAAITAAPRSALEEISAALWRAWGQGEIPDEEAQAIAESIETRKALPAPQKPARTFPGSRPKDPCLPGAPPALGRLGSLAAGLGRQVHDGRN